jgi:MFS transporter, putative metabolite:H+ symporter
VDLFMFADRRSPAMFWIGSLLVTAGVLLHLPMFLMARDMNYMMAGMPMDNGMIAGMVCIIAGIAAAGYGLQPRSPMLPSTTPMEKITPPEDAPLTWAHWLTAGALTVGLVIDVMKPASLGFVTPGMRDEYGITKSVVALLPFAALIGTVVGSVVWGALSDLYGRRATILLSAVMFIGTSICGAMPSFWWNIGMCFLMGAAAGGMLPVTYALLAEIMPTKYRGLSLVIVGGIGAVGGYLAASGFSAWLQPIFGWRIMWFLNLPTGLILVGLSAFIPESARFLIHIGQPEAARETLRRFGSVVVAPASADEDSGADHAKLPPLDSGYLRTTVALTLTALIWGLVNFGVLLWIPSELIAEGRSVGLASTIIAKSALIAAPMVAVAAWMYSAWSTKWSLVATMLVTTLGLLTLILRASGLPAVSNPIVAVALLIVGSTGVISILLPYAAENYPLVVRGRATGWVAACSKFGGLLAQGLGVLGAVPTLGVAAGVIALSSAVALALIALFGRETLGLDLRKLDRPVRAAA